MIDRVHGEMDVVREETFGPVSPVITLQGRRRRDPACQRHRLRPVVGVCTNRLDDIMRFVRELHVGCVNVWEVPGYRLEITPFGGIKDSGLGYKEGVQEACKSFTQREDVFAAVVSTSPAEPDSLARACASYSAQHATQLDCTANFWARSGTHLLGRASASRGVLAHPLMPPFAASNMPRAGARCEASIGCIRCPSGLGLRDWKSPNPQSLKEDSRMNTHKNARLTFARRLEMVRDITERGLSAAEAAAAMA